MKRSLEQTDSWDSLLFPSHYFFPSFSSRADHTHTPTSLPPPLRSQSPFAHARFNSSGATIVPDVRSSDSRGPVDGSNRMLSSQDSMGREFEAALNAGPDGMIRLLQGQNKNGSGGWDYLRGYSQVGASQESTPFSSQNATARGLTESGSFAFDLPQPTLLSHDPSPPSASASPAPPAPTTSPSNLHTHHNLPLDAHAASASPYPQPGAAAPASAGGGAGVELYRPVSSSSWHTEPSGSEYSYSATDVSEDHEMPLVSHTEIPDIGFDNMALGGGGARVGAAQAQANWNAFEAARQSLDFAPLPSGLKASAGGEGGGGVGPIRGAGAGAGANGVPVGEETAEQRQARLEHRRSINRKSAQKHRTRRKLELEDLNKAIMERDAKIALLEKELAVERARVAQVMAFLKEHAGFGGAAPGGQAHHQQGQQQGQGLPSPPAENALRNGDSKDARRRSVRAKVDK